MSDAPTRLTADDLRLSGGRSLGSTATLLQMSSGFCAPCRAARTVLQHVATGSSGVVHLDIDVAHHTELAQRLTITSTPTVLLLDRDGVVRDRLAGVPRLAAVRTAVAALA